VFEIAELFEEGMDFFAAPRRREEREKGGKLRTLVDILGTSKSMNLRRRRKI